MLSILIAFVRLGKAVYRASQNPEFRALLSIVIFLLICGPLFYSNVEHWSLLDSLYFCVMTMSTIGYGDLTPSSDVSKIFTILYSIISIGVFVSMVSKLAQAILSIDVVKRSGRTKAH